MTTLFKFRYIKISIITAVILLAAILFLPAAAFAAEPGSEESGTVTADSGISAIGSNDGGSESASETSDSTPGALAEDTSVSSSPGALADPASGPSSEAAAADFPAETPSGTENAEAAGIDAGSGAVPDAPVETPAAEGNSYTAEIEVIGPDPDGVAWIDKATDFKVTFTELSPDQLLGSAQLTIPGDFTLGAGALGAITASNGKLWTGGLVDHVLSLWAMDAASYLGQGESVSAIFTATPTAALDYVFETFAWTDAKIEGGVGVGTGSIVNHMAVGSSNPKIGGVYEPVANADALNNVRNNLGLNYRQTADIDLGVSPWNVGGGWVPIGTWDDPFTGKFDGAGYTISNLTIIWLYGWDQGLFGALAGAEVVNVTLEAVDIIGGDYTGALAGYAFDSEISNVHVTGVVSGDDNTGGLVGGAYNVEITGSSMDGTVTGSGYVGGLVGEAVGGTITGSSVTGTVTGSGYVGGLVGQSSDGATIYHSFTLGLVTGSANTGGLVGLQSGSGTIISDSYSRAEVRGASFV
ncbi:MAG TPA: GLUG motif-containing protein, partial [Candidatus Limnocylindrales bacterium]|nr:GLUG motif-containing protein [Candidatus Limnocylindrales bacterium]